MGPRGRGAEFGLPADRRIRGSVAAAVLEVSALYAPSGAPAGHAPAGLERRGHLRCRICVCGTLEGFAQALMKLRDIADRLGCRLEGDGELDIAGVAGMEHAGPGD